MHGATARRRTSALLRLWLAGLLFCTTAGAAPQRPAPALILGVHPYLSYSQLQLRFEPLARYLAEGLQRDVVLRIGRDYREHIEQAGRDLIDIVYLGPVSYVRLVERYGAKPLLARLERNGKATLDGHIVVRDDSPLRDVADLRGRTFAFGDPDSTMSCIVPRAVLADAGIRLQDLAHYRHYHGHTNVALAVLSGQVDAGAVKQEIYQQFEGLGLRSLAKLPEVSEHLFIARADLPPSTIDRLRTLLLGLGHSDRGRKILTAIHGDATGLVPVTDQDYDTLRTMLQAIGDERDARHRDH